MFCRSDSGDIDFAMLAGTNTKALLFPPMPIGFAALLLFLSPLSVTCQAQVTGGAYSGPVAHGTNSPGVMPPTGCSGVVTAGTSGASYGAPPRVP